MVMYQLPRKNEASGAADRAYAFPVFMAVIALLHRFRINLRRYSADLVWFADEHEWRK